MSDTMRLKVDFILSCANGRVTYYKPKSSDDLPALVRQFYAVHADCYLVGFGTWGIAGTPSEGIVSCVPQANAPLLWCDTLQNVVGQVEWNSSPGKMLKTWEAALPADLQRADASPVTGIDPHTDPSTARGAMIFDAVADGPGRCLPS